MENSTIETGIRPCNYKHMSELFTDNLKSFPNVSQQTSNKYTCMSLSDRNSKHTFHIKLSKYYIETSKIYKIHPSA